MRPNCKMIDGDAVIRMQAERAMKANWATSDFAKDWKSKPSGPGFWGWVGYAVVLIVGVVLVSMGWWWPQ